MLADSTWASSVVHTALFFLDGAVLAMALLIALHMWRIRNEIESTTARYMWRMCVFLIFVPASYLVSRTVALGFTGPVEAADYYRGLIMLVEGWACWGLIRWLGSRPVADNTRGGGN